MGDMKLSKSSKSWHQCSAFSLSLIVLEITLGRTTTGADLEYDIVIARQAGSELGLVVDWAVGRDMMPAKPAQDCSASRHRAALFD